MSETFIELYLIYVTYIGLDTKKRKKYVYRKIKKKGNYKEEKRTNVANKDRKIEENMKETRKNRADLAKKEIMKRQGLIQIKRVIETKTTKGKNRESEREE